MKLWKVIAINSFFALMGIGMVTGLIPTPLLLFLIGSFFVIALITSIVDGRVEGPRNEPRYFNIRKKKHPILFWLLVIGQLVGAFFFIFLAVYAFFEK